MEDFTTYTLTGAQSSKLVINSPTEVQLNNFSQGDEIILFKDYGAGFARGDEDLEIEYEIEHFARISGNVPWMTMFADSSDSYNTIFNSGDNAVGPGVYQEKARATWMTGGNFYNEETSFTFNLGVNRYCRFSHIKGSNIWLTESFEDAERTILHRSASLTFNELPIDFRYFHAVNNFDGGSGSDNSYYMRNLNIIKPVIGPEPEPVKMNPLLFGQNF